VREQVELYENSGGTKGTTLRDTGLPVVLVTHWRVKDGDNYRCLPNRTCLIAMTAYPPYADYQARTERQIPVFVAEP
jgi:hypothetical protein